MTVALVLAAGMASAAASIVAQALGPDTGAPSILTYSPGVIAMLALGDLARRWASGKIVTVDTARREQVLARMVQRYQVHFGEDPTEDA